MGPSLLLLLLSEFSPVATFNVSWGGGGEFRAFLSLWPHLSIDKDKDDQVVGHDGKRDQEIRNGAVEPNNRLGLAFRLPRFVSKIAKIIAY
jgi:hypothetical protein